MNEDNAVDKIGDYIESANGVLFGATGDPENALTHVDRAQDLSRGLTGDMGGFMREFITAYRSFAEGYLCLGREGNLQTALEHFSKARSIVEQLKEEHAKASGRPQFKAFELGIEAKILEIQVATADGQKRDELKAKLAYVSSQMLDTMPADSPIRRILEWTKSFSQAMQHFRESGSALARLHLDEATRYIREANNLMQPFQESFDDYKSLPFALQNMADLLRGFGVLLTARQAYINTLHDAVIGNVSERHIVQLRQADKQLRDGFNSIEKGIPALTEQVGAVMGDFPFEEMRHSIEFQREVTNNLRRLVKEGLSLKSITRRTSPRFLIYFALTFGVVLFGYRWSGLVSEIGDVQVVNLLIISIIVSVIASFGYEVGLKYVSAFKSRLGPSGKSDKG